MTTLDALLDADPDTDLDADLEAGPGAVSDVTAGQVKRSPTAEIVCAERAAETWRPEHLRIVNDPYARHFVTKPVYRALISSRVGSAATLKMFDRLYPGYLAIVLLRHRWFEQVLTNALADGIEQVVLLGAGYDTTALRRRFGTAKVFEVDAEPTQREKRAVIAAHRLDDRQVQYVPCDFERDSATGRLLEHGFDPTRPSLVAWWGVSFFLTEQAVRHTLRDVASVMASGSRLVFDYVERSVVDGTTSYKGARRAVAAVQRRGEPYQFGLNRDDVVPFVESFGFRVQDAFTLHGLAAECAPQFPYRLDDFFGVVDACRW